MSLQVAEWRSGDHARTNGNYGLVRSIVDGVAWVEFTDGKYEYNARIPLERLEKVDPAVVAALNVMKREAEQHGGTIAEAPCRACGALVHGHVVTDSGEPCTLSGPGVPAHLYVAAFVRECNCDVPRRDIERDLIVEAAQQEAA